MNINWVLADDTVIDPKVSIKGLKKVGSFWGSWKTWRAYSTDNVICYDPVKGEELVRKALHAACNFYLPKRVHESINSPPGVRLYDGDFLGHEVPNPDEIVAMFLASSVCDIVLLLGFDWRNPDETYLGLVTQALSSQPDVQWVLVDHPGTPTADILALDNVSQDTLPNVLKLLNS